MTVRVSAVDWKPGGLTPDEAVEISRLLAAHGCDAIDVSAGQTVPDQKPVYGRLFQTPFADRIRHEAGIATMAVGNVSSWMDVNTIVAAGRADLCLLARAHLFDPYWTRHAATMQGFRAAVATPVPVRGAVYAALRVPLRRGVGAPEKGSSMSSPTPVSSLGRFVAELRRRHVVRATVGYGAVGFVLLQMAEIALPAFLPGPRADAALRVLVVAFLLLFPVVVAMALGLRDDPPGPEGHDGPGRGSRSPSGGADGAPTRLPGPGGVRGRRHRTLVVSDRHRHGGRRPSDAREGHAFRGGVHHRRQRSHPLPGRSSAPGLLRRRGGAGVLRRRAPRDPHLTAQSARHGTGHIPHLGGGIRPGREVHAPGRGRAGRGRRGGGIRAARGRAGEDHSPAHPRGLGHAPLGQRLRAGPPGRHRAPEGGGRGHRRGDRRPGRGGGR